MWNAAIKNRFIELNWKVPNGNRLRFNLKLEMKKKSAGGQLRVSWDLAFTENLFWLANLFPPSSCFSSKTRIRRDCTEVNDLKPIGKWIGTFSHSVRSRKKKNGKFELKFWPEKSALPDPLDWVVNAFLFCGSFFFVVWNGRIRRREKTLTFHLKAHQKEKKKKRNKAGSSITDGRNKKWNKKQVLSLAFLFFF